MRDDGPHGVSESGLTFTAFNKDITLDLERYDDVRGAGQGEEPCTLYITFVLLFLIRWLL